MRFNKRQTNEDRVQNHPDLTVNHEGGIAFKVTPELELYLRACVGLFEDKFYQSGSDALEEIKAMVARCNRDFVLQLASFVRNEMYLRSMPVMLLAEASCLPQVKGEKPGMVRAYVPKVCTRADQPAELLAYMKNHLQMRTKKNLTFGIKRGLSDVLNKFNEYQLQKWDVKGREFKLKDVIQVVHPNPKDDEQSAIFKRALNDELKIADTWETYISVNGSTTENWEHVIDLWIKE